MQLQYQSYESTTHPVVTQSPCLLFLIPTFTLRTLCLFISTSLRAVDLCNTQGANNYSIKNTNMLLDIVKDELPLGQWGWTMVMTRYNKWAMEFSWPIRNHHSKQSSNQYANIYSHTHANHPLQLVKTTKPTETGICPPEVKQAHHIDKLINKWAGTHELANSDFDDIGNNINWPPSDKDALHPEPCVVVAQSNCNEAPAPHRTHGAAAADLLSSLSHVFDPTIQRAWDENQANCSLANIQLLTLSQQLHDLQLTNEKLHGQLFDLCNHLYEAQQAADYAEMHLEVTCSIQGPNHQASQKYQRPAKRNQFYWWFPDGEKLNAWLLDDDLTSWEVEPLASEGYSGKDLCGLSNTCIHEHYWLTLIEHPNVMDNDNKKSSGDTLELWYARFACTQSLHIWNCATWSHFCCSETTFLWILSIFPYLLLFSANIACILYKFD